MNFVEQVFEKFEYFFKRFPRPPVIVQKRCKVFPIPDRGMVRASMLRILAARITPAANDSDNLAMIEPDPVHTAYIDDDVPVRGNLMSFHFLFAVGAAYRRTIMSAVSRRWRQLMQPLLYCVFPTPLPDQPLDGDVMRPDATASVTTIKQLIADQVGCQPDGASWARQQRAAVTVYGYSRRHDTCPTLAAMLAAVEHQSEAIGAADAF